MSVKSEVVFEDDTYVYRGAAAAQRQAANVDAVVGIVETLYSEHGYLLSLLDSLELQANKLAPGKIPDYHLLLDIVHYLIHYPDEYHHPREDMLFSALLEKDKSFSRKLDRLLREHETLAHYNRELFDDLSRIAAGGKANRPELRERIKRYLSGYRGHIKYESEHVFPMAKGSLSADELARLDEKTRFINDPLFGAKIKQRYKRLGSRLQSRISSARDEFVAKEFSAAEAGLRTLSNAIGTIDQLWQTANELTVESWNEQLDTMKAHANPGNSPKLLLLPVALMQNHGRHWRRGITEVRKVLNSGSSDDA